MPRQTALRTELTERLGLRSPIIQAPMAGGATTVELVSAVCGAGALGYFGAAYMTPEQIGEAAKSLRALGEQPFGINLFAPQPEPPAADPTVALERLEPIHQELGLPPPQAPSAPAKTDAEQFQERLEAVLESGCQVFGFTFGIPPAAALAQVKAKGLFCIGTATTVAEAVALEAAGCDAVVAQGSEAGAHRGTFGAESGVDFADAMVGTMALVPQMVDAVGVPVIASGGIMDGRGIAAALALGASAVQMGTAFLTCAETGIPEAHKAAILAAEPHQTRVTRAFSGRPARGIVNRFMTEMERPGPSGGTDAILPFPVQNSLTRPLRGAAGQLGRTEFLSLWAGQGLGLARRRTAAELIAALEVETAQALKRVAALSR